MFIHIKNVVSAYSNYIKFENKNDVKRLEKYA